MNKTNIFAAAATAVVAGGSVVLLATVIHRRTQKRIEEINRQSAIDLEAIERAGEVTRDRVKNSEFLVNVFEIANMLQEEIEFQKIVIRY